jgi:hypothetical protein
MNRKPVSSKAILALIAGGLVLPIAITLVLAVSALLSSMGDSSGGLVLRWVALGCGIAWGVVLVCLVLVQGLNSLDDTDENDK